MKKEQRVAAIVVLYNPSNEVKENIQSYGDKVDVIYCVDNSAGENYDICDFDKVVYLSQHKNMGVAKALNIGCKKAIDDGADLIITFDQDTVCNQDTVQELVNYVNSAGKDVIAAPNIKHIYRDVKTGNRVFSDESVMDEENEAVDWVITSGSTFTAETYKNLGGFDEKLFISQVDQDFCFRLKMCGGMIYKIGKIYIYQEAGRTTKKKIGTKIVHIPNLDSKRYYYIFRNEMYLRQKWGKGYKRYRVNLLKYVVSILFFEDNKRQKIAACIKGIRDHAI